MIVAALNLTPGSILPNLGGRVVKSVERDLANLGATLITFTDGSWFHSGTFDAHYVTR